MLSPNALRGLLDIPEISLPFTLLMFYATRNKILKRRSPANALPVFRSSAGGLFPSQKFFPPLRLSSSDIAKRLRAVVAAKVFIRAWPVQMTLFPCRSIVTSRLVVVSE